MSDQTIVVDEQQSGERLDRATAALFPEISRTTIQTLIQDGEITVNERIVKSSYRLSAGERITLTFPPPPDETILPEQIPLDILYEDGDLAAINKPAGMVVHPAAGHVSGTLVNAILFRWPELQKVDEIDRAGIVHRLDKDTSGVILVAKNRAALDNLQAQFKTRTTKKSYLALVEGIPISDSGMIDAPIGRDPKQRKKMAVVRDGRAAKTRYEILERFEQNALLKLDLMTGRTHQIRVHLAWVGNPVVGDTVYGYKKQRIPLKRFFLHAQELSIDSPSTGERMTFSTPLPDDLERILLNLRQGLEVR